MASRELNVLQSVDMVGLAFSEDFPVFEICSGLGNECPGCIPGVKQGESHEVRSPQCLLNIDQCGQILLALIIFVIEMTFPHT